MSCDRCGWEKGEPHPPMCPSKFKVGDKVFLALDPDDAPVPATFLRISQFEPEVMVVVENDAGINLVVSYAALALAEKWPVLT